MENMVKIIWETDAAAEIPSVVLFRPAAAAVITQADLFERTIDYAPEVHADQRGLL